MALKVASQVELIPGYRLLERLGQGGFGEVWKAEAPGGLLKAVKIIHGSLSANGRDETHLKQELKALQRVKTVRHPFILSLERYDLIDGRLIIVSELADRTLWDRCLECRTQGLPGIPRDELLRYMEEAAEALDLMNMQFHLQHLDIKPQNLFLLFNHVKVGDFGLVKDLEGMFAAITSGVTAIYAAPETFEGIVSRFCDQYNLAIAYQELLTGQLPFDGTTGRQLMLQHVMSPPNLRPLPPGDQPVVARALAKKPEGRFPSCTDFIQALWQATGPAPTPPIADCQNSSFNPQSAIHHPQSAGPVVDPPAASCTPVNLDLNDHPTDVIRIGSQSASGVMAGPPPAQHPVFDTPSREAPRPWPSKPTDWSIKYVPPPPPPERPETSGEGVLFPALIVGLGGLGREVLQQFRKSLRKRGPVEEWPQIRLVSLDTDPEAFERASREPDAVLSPDEFLLTPFHRPSHYLKRPREREELERWLPLAPLANVPRGQTSAAGWRALGRLAFVSSAPAVTTRLRDELEACANPEALEAVARRTGLGLRTTRPRIYVVTSLTGGTGGGLFIDLALALRQTLRQLGLARAEVVAVLLVPSAERGADARAVANSFAALTELRYFTVIASANARGNADAPPSPDLPFNRCVLLPLPAAADGSQAMQELATLAGDFLCRDLTTPLGRLADEGRTALAPGGKPPEAAAGMTCQTFGAYWFSVPRRPLLQRVAQHICDRLVRSWGIHDDKALDTAIEAWAADQLVRVELAPEPLEARLREACTAALGQTPGAYFDALLRRWQKGGSADLQRHSRAVEDALAEMEQLLGPPEREPALDLASPLLTALKEASHTLAKEAEKQLAEMVLAALGDPQFRLAGAEADAQKQLGVVLGKSAQQCKRLSDQRRRLVLDVLDRLPPLHEELREGGIFRGKAKARAAADIITLFRDFMAARWECAVALAVSRLMQNLQVTLHRYQRGVPCCHKRIAQFLKTFRDPATAGKAQVDLGLGRYLLPFGCRTLEEAVKRILDSLPADEEHALHENVWGLVRQMLQDHVHVCTGPATLFRDLRESIDREVEKVAEDSLGRAHAAEMYMEQHAADPDAAADLAGAFDEAQPELAASRRTPREELCILAVPPGPEGEHFRSLVKRALPKVPMTAAPSTDDIVFYREQPQLTLTELPQLGPAAREMYEQVLTSDPCSPHSRCDITSW